MWATAALVLGAFFPAAAVRGDEPALPLAKLEERLSGAFLLQAAQEHVVSAAQTVGVETAKSGLRYVTASSVGLRSDIITNTLNQEVLRYGQLLGVQAPLLGRRFAQNQSIVSAKLDAESAIRTYAEDKRQVLAQLREAYVLYWQFDRESSIAGNYVSTVSRALRGARGLRRFGFWTQGDFLAFLVSLSQGRTEAQASLGSRRAELTRLSSVLGQDVGSFRPVAPTFADGCEPRLADAVASAIQVDPTVARLEAQISADSATLNEIGGSSIDAAAQAGVGSVVDYPERTGYDISVSLTATLPTHARAEERAHRRALKAEISDLGFQERQRLADIRASVSQALDDYTNAKLVLAQARQDERLRRESLREAQVRFETLDHPAPGPFNEVQSSTVELFVSSRGAADSAAAVLLKANQLLLLAPGACPASQQEPATAAGGPSLQTDSPAASSSARPARAANALPRSTSAALTATAVRPRLPRRPQLRSRGGSRAPGRDQTSPLPRALQLQNCKVWERRDAPFDPRP